MNIVVEKIVNDFVSDLNKLNKDNIHSVYVYGSAAGQGYVQNSSDINVLIILREINSGFLESNSKLVKKYEKKNKLAPLFLTERHINTSQDVFPMEFTEIREIYQLVYGEDLLKNLNIDMSNIRLQCEQLVKGQLIRIYQILLEIGNDKKKKLELLMNSIGSILPALRAMLRLGGSVAPRIKKELLEEFSKEYKIDVHPLFETLALKESKSKPKDIDILVDGYIKVLQNIAGVVDRLNV